MPQDIPRTVYLDRHSSSLLLFFSSLPSVIYYLHFLLSSTCYNERVYALHIPPTPTPNRKALPRVSATMHAHWYRISAKLKLLPCLTGGGISRISLSAAKSLRGIEWRRLSTLNKTPSSLNWSTPSTRLKGNIIRWPVNRRRCSGYALGNLYPPNGCGERFHGLDRYCHKRLMHLELVRLLMSRTKIRRVFIQALIHCM